MKIEVWTDIMCPYCHIGKIHYEKALRQVEHAAEVQIDWKNRTEKEAAIHQEVIKGKSCNADGTCEIYFLSSGDLWYLCRPTY